jgi:hypothetical protein
VAETNVDWKVLMMNPTMKSVFNDGIVCLVTNTQLKYFDMSAQVVMEHEFKMPVTIIVSYILYIWHTKYDMKKFFLTILEIQPSFYIKKI